MNFVLSAHEKGLNTNGKVGRSSLTSGVSATNSAAYLRMSSALAAPQRGGDLHVAAIALAQLLQAVQERRVASLVLFQSRHFGHRPPTSVLPR